MGDRRFKTTRGSVVLAPPEGTTRHYSGRVAALFCELVVRIDTIMKDLTCTRIQVEHTLHLEHGLIGSMECASCNDLKESIRKDNFCQTEHGASGTQMENRVAGMIPSMIVAAQAE